MAQNGNNGTNGQDGLNGKDGVNGVDGINGTDGVTPQFIYDEDTGYLLVSYDDGFSWDNLVHIGDMISDGVDGVSISSCKINEAGELVVEYSDGKSDNLGVIVAKNGADGIGIADVALDENGALTVTLTDGTVLPLGNVNGIDGINGTDGKDGANGITPQIRINDTSREWEVSYDGGVTWKSLGVVATGNHGQNGDDGVDGQNGITPHLRINADTNMWEVSYDNEASWHSLGVLASGKDGKDAIAPRIKIENGEWMISYNNGTSWEKLDAKAVGNDGEDGKDGRGIEKMEIVGGYLWVTYTDGNRVNVGKVIEDQVIEGEGGEGSGGAGTGSTVVDIYVDALEFYPLGDGSEYGVKIGNAIYMDTIIIPAYYNGKPVTTILRNAFSINGETNEKLTTVKIGENIVEIEREAFLSCDNITYLYIPKNVQKIGEDAFPGIDEVEFEISENEIPGDESWTESELGCDYIIWNNET